MASTFRRPQGAYFALPSLVRGTGGYSVFLAKPSGIGPLPKPATKAMKGLLAKSLISVAEAVSTILALKFVANFPVFSDEVVEKRILDCYIKHYRSQTSENPSEV
jgi:hypothetical protein